MTGALRQMLACHWSARRIQRYLDADPVAQLTPGEVARIEGHLATCQRCATVATEHRALHRALTRWSGGSPVDPRSVDRVRRFVSTLDDRGTA